MIQTEITEFKGHNLIQLPLEETENFNKGRTFSFGVKKAKAILKFIDDIKKFVKDEEK